MRDMKSIIKALCVALLAVGCNDMEAVDNSINNELVKIIIEASSDESRTYINESANRVEWNTLDMIGVIENDKYSNSLFPSISDGKAQFSVSFTKNTSSTSFIYNAIYPSLNYTNGSNIDAANVTLTLPATQAPSATSFDAKADILIAKQQTKSVQAKKLSLQFKRVVAMAKATIKGLPSGAKISKVVFTAAGKALAGNYTANLTTGTISVDESNAEDTITIEYSNSIAATSPIYFNTLPASLSEGDRFNITITTDGGSSYTKSVTLGRGKSLSFEEGNLATFSIDMSNTAVQPSKKYQVGEIYNENGVKGLVVGFKSKYLYNADYTKKIGTVTYGYVMSLDEGYTQWATTNGWTNCYSGGDINTQTLVSLGIDNYPAAKWCVEHGAGWYLPTSTELSMMWQTVTEGEFRFSAPSVAKYNKLFKDNGGDKIEETFYWTSTEIYDTHAEVFAFMERSYVCNNPEKSSQCDVRAAYMYEVERTYYE